MIQGCLKKISSVVQENFKFQEYFDKVFFAILLLHGSHRSYLSRRRACFFYEIWGKAQKLSLIFLSLKLSLLSYNLIVFICEKTFLPLEYLNPSQKYVFVQKKFFISYGFLFLGLDCFLVIFLFF